MTKIITALLFSILFVWGAEAQDQLVKDLDGDSIKDTVSIVSYIFDCDSTDENHTKIICHLSSRQFREIQSEKIRIEYWTFFEIQFGLVSTKNGFEFYVNYTRDGLKGQFRYNKQAKKIQLIGMSRYEIGDSDGDNKGKSSVNLLTDEHIGDWQMYDYNLDKLFKVPTIKTKMDFGTIYLEDFSDETLLDYSQRCQHVTNKRKMKLIRDNMQ